MVHLQIFHESCFFNSRDRAQAFGVQTAYEKPVRGREVTGNTESPTQEGVRRDCIVVEGKILKTKRMETGLSVRGIIKGRGAPPSML